MTIGILLIAHAPLASALRACVLHVFPEVEHSLYALDVAANEPPEDTLATARTMMRRASWCSPMYLAPPLATWRKSWLMACIPSWWLA